MNSAAKSTTEDKSSPRKWAATPWVYCIFVAASFFSGFFIAGIIVKSSAFVIQSPIQYSEAIFRFYVAVLCTSLCAAIIGASAEDHTVGGKALRFCSVFPLMAAGFVLFFRSFLEQRVDVFGVLLAVSAGMAGAASLLERHDRVAGRQLVFVEMPLLLGAIIVVMIKYFWYYESSDRFIGFVVNRLNIELHLPDKGHEIRDIEEWFREHFWQGITVGVLMIQLLSAQITSIVIRFQRD